MNIRTWTRVGRCGPRVVKPARYCRFKGRRYAVHATRCTKRSKYRCARPNHWKRIGRCRR